LTAIKEYMSKHFQWYASGEGSDQVIPWNARYAFPSQANKSQKSTPRIPPKNGSVFNPGQVIRLEFPAQGYVNTGNTTLEFDVTLQSYGTDTAALVRFQNNIQSIFSRLRVLYGSTTLEDIVNYNVIVRSLTEWTATNETNSMDQTSIAEGIGGFVVGTDLNGVSGVVNVRQAFIQGLDNNTAPTTPAAMSKGTARGNVPNQYLGPAVASGQKYCTRRYQINIASGLFTQDKLIPSKFMASQFALEFTLESAAGCIFALPSIGSPGTLPTYTVSNVNLIPEIIEFDASYDLGIMEGLSNGGVPIKFSTWHTYIFNIGGSSNANLQIQERSRSVKALFAVQRGGSPNINTDSHATFFDSCQSAVSSMQSYQFRIGARYFPAAPVELSTGLSSEISNGGAEAFIELQKALNVVGDYRLSSSVHTNRWAVSAAAAAATVGSGVSSRLNELDYCTNLVGYNATGEALITASTVVSTVAGTANSFSGTLGSACFAIAIDLETSSGAEISGLNAEEQSDISLLVKWKNPQYTNYVMEVYAYVDQMIILRANNMLELIQ
jgi:hypothetical protein